MSKSYLGDLEYLEGGSKALRKAPVREDPIDGRHIVVNAAAVEGIASAIDGVVEWFRPIHEEGPKTEKAPERGEPGHDPWPFKPSSVVQAPTEEVEDNVPKKSQA